MPEPTIQQVFGSGATQDATTLTISKADLVTKGLTASATNTAESLMVGILLLAKDALTAAGLDTNPDQSISIEDSFDSLVTRNNQTFRQKTYSINLQKLDTSSTIDPDDY
ncbi:hypothetical protein [Gloeocapsopsis dulcis]|uniref:hypothetical protein n=1 Tax=Gloeocapsopsis dulcis TaxID=2859516 RepID=UPI002B25BCBD|nr:hypothetical protein [Gloeocapsopsis dulcis]WNN89706.1 hypothetical protein P0S91_00995 [Gloeocapsopsis dulcis]WNN91552.1 hypothetical protein P0S91_10960 [Gloeocapsopsis dulcis]